ncbi:hypothetical protein FOA52_013409 [Chlamydomonas sp. UWO 241]|nr:hypothetical protein FOA52_013409 [Chlamydomonas sp. UWO 241]
MSGAPEAQVGPAEAGPSEVPEVEVPTDMNLADVFKMADSSIPRIRADNIFKQLDERKLTEQEEDIIQQRVDLQRKMYLEYERREQARKVQELQGVIPALDADSARRALSAVNWREEDAAVRFASDPAFQRMVLRSSAAPSDAGGSRRGQAGAKAPGARPKVIDPSLLESGGVFVGRFKSKLGAYQDAASTRALLAGITRARAPPPPPAAGGAASGAPTAEEGAAGAGATRKRAREGLRSGGDPACTSGAGGSGSGACAPGPPNGAAAEADADAVSASASAAGGEGGGYERAAHGSRQGGALEPRGPAHAARGGSEEPSAGAGHQRCPSVGGDAARAGGSQSTLNAGAGGSARAASRGSSEEPSEMAEPADADQVLGLGLPDDDDDGFEWGPRGDLSQARFAADRGQMITIVSAYSPTEAASDEEAGDFYLRVAALADKANDKRDLLIVAAVPDGVLKAMTESFDKLYGGETKLSDETLNQLENDVAAFELTRATEVDEAHGRPPDLAETEACVRALRSAAAPGGAGPSTTAVK